MIDDELENFKTRVNLSEYAASSGYALDRRASSRNCAVMVHPGGDKIIVARGEDGHWIYFSVRDDADNGTIIDFVQKRRRLSLGQVRQELRRWIGAASLPCRPASDRFVPDLSPATRDLLSVRRRFEAMQPLGSYHRWLVEVRRIPPALLTLDRVAAAIRTDERGNVIFPHFNADGVCGYEIKNAGFTGFAAGGTKGLWSAAGEHDERLVIAETAIDALSYAAIAGPDGARLVSIAGQMNPEQPALLSQAIRALPTGGEVVIATDADAGGDQLAGQIARAFSDCGRSDIELREDRPSVRETDWNDVLSNPRTDSPSPT